MLVISVTTEITSIMHKTLRSASSLSLDESTILPWIERVAAFWTEQSGLPPITGRIVGWLMICDPPEQSAGQIADGIGASRASLTSSMRLLAAIGLVHSARTPGERTVRYRIDDNAWEMTLRRRIASLTSFRKITTDGLAMLGKENPRAARIRAADEIYAWAETLFESAPRLPDTTSRRKSRKTAQE